MKTKMVITAVLVAGWFCISTNTSDAQKIVKHPKYYNISKDFPNDPLVTIANPWAWPNHIITNKKDISSFTVPIAEKPFKPMFKKKPKVWIK